MNYHWLSILFITGVVHSTSALSIDCGEFHDVWTFTKPWGLTFYSCNGTVVADANNNRMRELFGLHFHGRNSSNNQRFVLNNENLTSFPTNVEKFFPHLRVIDYSFNFIDRVTHNHLQPHTGLYTLLLEHNKISTLDGNLFDGLDQLVYVRLNHNDIKHVDYDIKLPFHFFAENNPCTPNALLWMDDKPSDILRTQCPPLQSTIGQSVDITNNVETINIVDHTQEKDESSASEKPCMEITRERDIFPATVEPYSRRILSNPASRTICGGALLQRNAAKMNYKDV